MNQPNRAGGIAVRLFLYLLVVWAALLLAQSLGGGLPDILANLTAALERPFAIRWTERSLISILICSALYAAALCYFSANRGRTRDGAEHGSASWGTPRLVNNLIQATTPKSSHNSDPFWEKSETALLQAIILMLWQEAPEYEQNFSMVMRVLEYAEVKEEDDEYVSPLDLLFQSIERERPECVAVRQYKVFKMAAGKTAHSILVSTAVRLAPFDLPQIKAITDHDDMELLTPDEVRALDNRYAILFIRGAKPVLDLKYDLTKHPAVGHIVDGGGLPYIHHQKKPETWLSGAALFAPEADQETEECEHEPSEKR